MIRTLALGALVFLAPTTAGWAQVDLPKRVVELRIRVAGGPEVRIVEPDGGLATLTLKDGPPLGLTPIIRDLDKRQVRLTVFDLRPGGKPGKRVMEDLDVSTETATPTARTAPRLEVTLVGVREVDR